VPFVKGHFAGRRVPLGHIKKVPFVKGHFICLRCIFVKNHPVSQEIKIKNFSLNISKVPFVKEHFEKVSNWAFVH
jgi:hypothetical protein